jgi:hypothetical protein
MRSQSESLERFYASGTLFGFIRSGLTLLKARKVKPRDQTGNTFDLSAVGDQLLYFGLIAIPAVVLEAYQSFRERLTSQPRGYSSGAWQFYLQFGLREDLAHHTNETIGYYTKRPQDATELDDLTAWIMTVAQFLWGYEDLMGVIWDEWTTLRLLTDTIEESGLQDQDPFRHMIRQWELARPYAAPLNGTYADVRRAAFDEFVGPRLSALPEKLRESVTAKLRALSSEKRDAFKKQMSLQFRLIPGGFVDSRDGISLWDLKVGLVLRGRYYLIDLVAHDEHNRPIVYGPGGNFWPLKFQNGIPVDQDGEKLALNGVQLFRQRDDEWVGYLDMSPASRIKGQLKMILEEKDHELTKDEMVDILLAETPRKAQRYLRRLLPETTQVELEDLSRASIIVNWDTRQRDTSLAELRRVHRGIGDHALTIIRTQDSMVFDQSHVFFDGTWAMAMAEVLTNAAVQWCKRCITIAPSLAPHARKLTLRTSQNFAGQAKRRQQVPEISAETTIYDISQIFKLREALIQNGTRLTINDLLVITRIFHAAHYRPSPQVNEQINDLRAKAHTAAEKHAVAEIDRSLERGRFTNPALLIPVDASLLDPRERIFPITFRSLADSLVWAWDDTWDSYQAYRRIEPPDTPEGIEALKNFARQRTFLIENLRKFSHILSANKSVAMRGESLNIAILNFLSHLPVWLQRFLNFVPEQFLVLNEIIKGDEVYSNVGRVAQDSSITRFMSAKDDGNTKALVWGVMTDDTNRLIVTMRDFRPHVKALIHAGRTDLADSMAKDYVVTYTWDLLGLVARLSAMLQTEAPPQ